MDTATSSAAALGPSAAEPTLRHLVAIFDVTPVAPDDGAPDDGAPDDRAPARFTGDSDGGGRNVVEGSQILAQSIVAASKAFPGRTARTAHALFAAAARPGVPLEFTVAPVKAGRSFASAVVTVTQDGKPRVTATVLLDNPQPDVIRHDRPAGAEAEASPDESSEASMPLAGRELRVAGVEHHDSPDEAGPPTLDAWLRYATVPERDDLRRALLAHFTGHLSIATTFRAHPGIGTAQAHHTISTAPMGIGITFHEPVGWDGWIRYHHESTYAGAGMSYVRGQVRTRDGRIVASFTQDGMIRALDATGSAISASSRL